MAQDPVASSGAELRSGGTLADAWNATLIGRYVKSHHISRTALVAAAVGVAVLFFVVGAALRLLVGPISLSPFSAQISDALAQALPGLTIKYDQAAVEWSRDQGRVNLVVLGAQVLDTQGRIIAQAPQADIDLAAGPFVQGKIVVTRVTLVGVQLTLVRIPNGTLRLGVEHGEGQADVVQRITDAINKSSSSASSLQAFAIRDARVAFKDETTGLFLVSPRAAVRISDSGPNLVATLEADVEVTGQAAHVSGEMIVPPRAGPVSGKVRITHLDIAALGRNAKMFSFLQSVAMTADLSASFAIQGAHLLNAQFGIGARGTAVLVGIRKPVNVRTLRLMGRYDRATSRISFDDATLDSDQMQAHIVGRADLFFDPTGAIERLGVVLTADKTALSVPGGFAQPVFLPLITLRGSYLPATHDILIDQLNTSGGALVLDTTGKITLVDNKSPVLDIKGRIAPMAVRDLLRYWPLGIGQGARDWIDRSVYSGSIGPLVFETHLPAGALDQPVVPDGAVLMTFPIFNVEANYVTGLTHLTGVVGTARLTGNRFSAEFSSARIGPLVVSHGQATIPDLSAPGSPGDISAHVEGTMGDILKLTDLQPLNYPTRFGIDPNQTAGKAAVDMKFHMPMLRNLSVNDINISVRAAVTGFGIALGKDVRLSDGAVTFDIDNNHLHAFGSAALASSRLNLDWVEDFRASGVTSKVFVKGTLDEAGREMLGLRISSYLRGPVGVSGTLVGRRGELTAADLTLDLTAAALSLDLVGITKPAGFPASAHVTVAFGSHTAIQSETLAITGPSLAATMTMSFDPKGTLIALDAPSVRSGASNDFSFNLQRGAAGLDITIRGHSLDGTQLARRGSNSGGGGSGRSSSAFDEPFHVSARLDRIVLRSGVVIAPFALDVTGFEDRPATMTLSGSIGKAGTIAGSIGPAGNDRHLSLTASDAGTLARGLFGFSSMKNGKLDVQATLHGPAMASSADSAAANDYEGTVLLSDFRLLNQPFLARLFSAGSLIGFGNLLQGGGIAVDELKIPFSASNGVFGIHDARATGPAIGVSADGYLDRPRNEIALKGTLVPLFGINSVLGIIPGLGNLLVSKPGEGIIGMVYTASGDADEPKVTINPLSLAFPGITRRIWEGKMPEAANAPSNVPPAPVVVTPESRPTQSDMPKP